MAYIPKNYVDGVGPDVAAAWLNQLDQLANNALESAITVPALQTILGITAPLTLPIPTLEGGTGGSYASPAAVLAALGGTTLAAVESTINQGYIGAQLYPVQPDESGASPAVTPTNYYYPPGDLRRYGGDPTGVADSSAAIRSAAAVQAVSNREIVVDGIFAYTPTARIDIKGEWRGFGKLRSAIHVNTGSFGGDYFRGNGHSILRDLTIQATTGTGVGTGVYLSNDPDTAFTGDIRVSGVNIVGFNIGLSIGNVYKVLFDRVDISGNNYGEYCVPNPTGGGYCNLVQHLNCDIYNNGVNVYFNPSVNCNEVAYYNCAIEDATGTTLVSGLGVNAYFANVATLRMHSTYCEGSLVTYSFYFASVSNLDLIGMDNQSNGQILIANANTVASLIAVNSSAALAAGGSSTPVNLLLLNCSFPASGSTYNLLTSIILNTNINTSPSTTKVNYISLNGNQIAGWGTPTGAAVVNNFPGASATLVQCSEALAQIITTLKSTGFFAT